MKNTTRLAFDAFLSRQAELNGVSSAEKKFTVAPTVEQSLEKRIQESADFLMEINMPPVDEQSGEKLGLFANGPIAGRTDTTANDRQTRDISGMDNDTYECKQTNFDSHITYAKLDLWAKFPNFQTLIRDIVVEQQGRDRLMIGFNGTSHATETNLGKYPLLQDVNIGWLEKMRVNNAARVISGLKIGNQDGADYKTLDAAVYDLLHNSIEPWHRGNTAIRAICDSDLVSDKYLALIDNNDAPTERAALETIMTNKQLGGKPTISVPFFPTRTVLLTAPNNLSIYWQAGTRRRHIKDKPERDRIEDYQSVNEAYVVEDYTAAAMLEGILVPNPNGDGTWV